MLNDLAFVSNGLRDAIRRATRPDEGAVMAQILPRAQLDDERAQQVQAIAYRLVEGVRARGLGGGIESFLHEYKLSSREGVTLMCLAEALLRIPDAVTADALIRDKLGDADWASHAGHSGSLFVNASTWGLILTGKVIAMGEAERRGVGALVGDMVSRLGEPVIRTALRQAMRFVGQQFVQGRTIEEGLDRARSWIARGYRFSFDMLGEAARTRADAMAFFHSYAHAIATLGAHNHGQTVFDRSGVSVKLSALHPRYEFAQRERVMAELLPRLIDLARMAARAELNFCIDAEESERLDLSLDLIEALALEPSLRGWDGLGLAVQAYQKRALPLLDWLDDLAGRSGRRLMVRLVKGAYWDSEIKRAQEGGQAGFPVFTRKVNTDVSYLACAERLLASPARFYPQFATHNAHTVASILVRAKGRDYEFQRLHGMGEALYEQVSEGADKVAPCRIYAPVGSHEALLPYLVRRLLENGANASFVHRIADAKLPIEQVIQDPVALVTAQGQAAHPRIVLPEELYGPGRPNARGLDLNDPLTLAAWRQEITRASQFDYIAAPILDGAIRREGPSQDVKNPADLSQKVGRSIDADPAMADQAVDVAMRAQVSWNAQGAAARTQILRRCADRLEADRAALLWLLMAEAGKTLPDALAEVREAVDFCRYYALRAEEDFAPRILPGPVGEENSLRLEGRGVFVCISPWNFPLAIFIGQVAAALAAGNAVIAKPAEQTPLIAARAVEHLLESGVPPGALQFLPGPGDRVGAALTRNPRVAGVAFTGGTDTAQAINRALAARQGPLATVIAETGGLNAMIVDSSALPDQVIADVTRSAFNAAGQRCSALRMLWVQEDAAPRILEMLAGAMEELRVGNPAFLSTDIGPVIAPEALAMLRDHREKMRGLGRPIAEAVLPSYANQGHYFAPVAFEIDPAAMPKREVFGPALHVMRFAAGRLGNVVARVNEWGYGLTLGVHSRIDDHIETVRALARVGNLYVNRNMIGAVVGAQPFGGEGLSGTGPKAGGPHYLPRFAVERTVSIDRTAAGGNAALMAGLDD